MLSAVVAIACPSGAVVAAELSQPKYKIVVDKDVRIPTRDGSYHLKNNTLYLGGNRASYVLLPIVPPKSGPVPNLGGISLKSGGN